MQIQTMIPHRIDVPFPRSTFQRIMPMVKNYLHSIEKCHQIMCTTELDRLDFFSLEITVAISTIVGEKDFFQLRPCNFTNCIPCMQFTWPMGLLKILKVKNETVAEWEWESPILAPWFYNNETTYPGDWFPRTKVIS